jgi:hypothetical protein
VRDSFREGSCGVLKFAQNTIANVSKELLSTTEVWAIVSLADFERTTLPSASAWCGMEGHSVARPSMVDYRVVRAHQGS